jgi:hypothetical protein
MDHLINASTEEVISNMYLSFCLTLTPSNMVQSMCNHTVQSFEQTTYPFYPRSLRPLESFQPEYVTHCRFNPGSAMSESSPLLSAVDGEAFLIKIIYGLSLVLIYYHNHHMQKQCMGLVTRVIGANKLNNHQPPLIIQSLPSFLYSHHQYSI